MDSIEFECNKSRLVIDKSSNFIHFTYEDKDRNIKLVPFPIKNIANPNAIIEINIETDYNGCEFSLKNEKSIEILNLKIFKTKFKNSIRFIPYYLRADIYIVDNKERTDKILQLVEMIKSL